MFINMYNYMMHIIYTKVNLHRIGILCHQLNYTLQSTKRIYS